MVMEYLNKTSTEMYGDEREFKSKLEIEKNY